MLTRRAPSTYALWRVMITLCLGVSLATSAAAQPMRLEIVELYSRSAEEMIPLLRPMLAPGGSITGANDKLVIRTTPANFAELRRILDTVDAPPQRLLITLRRDSAARRDSRDVELSGSVGSKRGRIAVPANNGDESRAATVQQGETTVRLRAQASAGAAEDASTSMQSVQVIEGRPAFLGIGESVPLTSSTAAGGSVTEYHDVVTGLYVVARLRGDQVRLELASSADTLVDRDSGAAAIRRSSTVVTGLLGEWLEVDAVVSAAAEQQHGLIYNRQSASRQHSRTYIKVEKIR